LKDLDKEKVGIYRSPVCGLMAAFTFPANQPAMKPRVEKEREKADENKIDIDNGRRAYLRFFFTLTIYFLVKISQKINLIYSAEN
jgi:hypothetical protein